MAGSPIRVSVEDTEHDTAKSLSGQYDPSLFSVVKELATTR
jgi:hypothetical protein